MSEEFKDTYIVFRQSEIREIEEITLQKNCDNLCLEFAAKIAYSWWIRNRQRYIQEFDIVDVYIGRIKHRILIDESEVCLARDFYYSIKGRDISSLIVDSSVESETSFKGKKPSEIGKSLIRPFRELDFIPSDEPILSEHSIYPGDTVFDAVVGASRKQGLHLVNDFNGRLAFQKEIRSIGSIRFTPEKFPSFKVKRSSGGRFSKYSYKGQSKGGGSIFGNDTGPKERNIVDSIIDEDVSSKVHKPLFVSNASIEDQDTARKHLIWQRRIGEARSRSYSADLIGIRTDEGNTLDIWSTIKFSFPELGISEDLLISSIQYTINKTSVKSAMELTGRDAYDVDPIEKKHKKKKKEKDILGS